MGATIGSILIVEDDAFVAMDIELWLEDRFRAQVIVASTLQAAFSACTTRFDLAVLDVNVTDGQTFDLARTLRVAETPFVFVCAHPRESFPFDLREAPYVAKPWSEKLLSDAIMAAL